MTSTLLRFLFIALLWRCMNGQEMNSGSGSGSGLFLSTMPVVNNTEVTLLADTSGTTLSMFESGSGFTGETTGTTFEPFTGINQFNVTSGAVLTTEMESGSGFSTTALLNDTEVTTTTDEISTTSFVEISATSTDTSGITDSMSGSGCDTTTPALNTTIVSLTGSVTDTTLEGNETTGTTFEPFTGTEQFSATSGAVLATGFDYNGGGGGLDWYFIVIICMGIIIFIILLILVFCCWKHYCSEKKFSVVKTNKLTTSYNETENEEMQLKLLKANPIGKFVPSARPVLDEEIIPTVIVKPTPLAHDPSLSVRKREVKQRPVSKIQVHIQEDEGFMESPRDKLKLIPVPVSRPEPLVYTPRSVPHQNTIVVEDSSPVLLPKMDHQQFYHGPEATTVLHPVPQQYIFPPVREAFLTTRPQDAVQSRAIAENQALTRSEIERHKNKQRLRRQKSMNSRGTHDSMRKEMDAVLDPGLPSVFRLESSRKQQWHKEKHAKDVGRVPPAWQQPKDVSADSTSDKTSISVSPEETIRKMTKLLAQAYSIISPSVQKNTVDLASQQQTVPVIPAAVSYPEGHAAQSGSDSRLPTSPVPDQMLFTRTHAPVALLPNNGQPDSISWSPYRTFDELLRLQAESSITPRTASTLGPNNIFSQNSGSLGQPFHFPIQSSGNALLPGDISAMATAMPERVQQPVNGAPGHQALSGHANLGIPTALHDTPCSDSNDSTVSLVKSIKESLARLTRSSTPVQNIDQANESIV